MQLKRTQDGWKENQKRDPVARIRQRLAQGGGTFLGGSRLAQPLGQLDGLEAGSHEPSHDGGHPPGNQNQQQPGEKVRNVVQEGAKQVPQRFCYHGQLEGVEKGVFRDKYSKLAVLSILGTLNAIPRWYSPRGELSAEEIGEALADFFIKGLSAGKVAHA